jgi:hypothetical protein
VDILSKLPFLSGDANNDETIDEVALEVEAKADRIKFHRAHVRNGPANFKEQTSGQVRRAKVRALAGRTRKAARAQRREHFAQRAEHALLRGHLQAIGVIAYETDFVPTQDARFVSARWVLNNYGGDLSGDDFNEAEFLRAAVQAAFDRFSDISGVERSEVEYA